MYKYTFCNKATINYDLRNGEQWVTLNCYDAAKWRDEETCFYDELNYSVSCFSTIITAGEDVRLKNMGVIAVNINSGLECVYADYEDIHDSSYGEERLVIVVHEVITRCKLTQEYLDKVAKYLQAWLLKHNGGKAYTTAICEGEFAGYDMRFEFDVCGMVGNEEQEGIYEVVHVEQTLEFCDEVVNSIAQCGDARLI